MMIQRLGVDETARLRELRLRSLRESPDAFAATVDEVAGRPDSSWRTQLSDLATFVAVDGALDVGIVRAGAHDERPDDAILLSTWVAPTARGRGVGDALIGAVSDWARAEGYVRLLLDVGDENMPAIKLYARMGFLPTGRASALPPPRDHVLEHERCLDLGPSQLDGAMT